jgi:hypothetical protein
MVEKALNWCPKCLFGTKSTIWCKAPRLVAKYSLDLKCFNWHELLDYVKGPHLPKTSIGAQSSQPVPEVPHLVGNVAQYQIIAALECFTWKKAY